MERRALLAVGLSVLILILYQEVVLKRFYPQPETAPETPEAVAPIAEAPRPEANEAAPVPPAPAKVPAVADVAPEPRIAGREIIVETDLYRAVFTTAGARLKRFELKHFRKSVAQDSPPLNMVGAGPTDPLPLGIFLRNRKTKASDALVAYQPDSSGLHLSGNTSGTLTFSGEVGGKRVIKRIEARGDRYFLTVRIEVVDAAPTYTDMIVDWPHPEGSQRKGHEIIFDSVSAFEAGKLHKESFGKIGDGKLLEKGVGWVAYTGKYFLAALVPEADLQPQANGDGGARVWLREKRPRVDAQLVLPAGRFAASFDLYLGPKSIDILKGHPLRRAVDLGWFSFVALPMLRMLKLSHRVSGNYGVDILLLTILIKVLFFPLTQKSFKSMKAMQKLQPEMKRIREQLKDKPEEMNRATMELYRRHKVNPLSGCLPMVMQMPVFIGLYEALLNSVELRHAPFIGWINDLSAPDRLGSLKLPFVEPAGIPVLTVLMGLSMLAQQWMTPTTTADPMQQRMMMLMPLVFTFMFINFPSGLTLYWLVNNILTVAQQVAINRSATAE